MHVYTRMRAHTHCDKLVSSYLYWAEKQDDKMYIKGGDRIHQMSYINSSC